MHCLNNVLRLERGRARQKDREAGVACEGGKEGESQGTLSGVRAVANITVRDVWQMCGSWINSITPYLSHPTGI